MYRNAGDVLGVKEKRKRFSFEGVDCIGFIDETQLLTIVSERTVRIQDTVTGEVKASFELRRCLQNAGISVTGILAAVTRGTYDSETRVEFWDPKRRLAEAFVVLRDSRFHSLLMVSVCGAFRAKLSSHFIFSHHNLGNIPTAFLYALSVCLKQRYCAHRRAADLEECIEVGRETLRATPDDHPNRPIYLRYLGGRLGHRFAVGSPAVDFEDAVSHYRSTLYQRNAPTGFRVQAGRTVLLYYAIATHWQEAYHTAHAIVDLLPRLTPRSHDHSDRQHLMGEVVGLASDSAAVTLLAGKEQSVALGFLEQGRGVIASSLEDVPTDIVVLRERHPQLAEAFEGLRDKLESGSTVLEQKQQSQEDIGSQRYKAGNLFDQLIVDIRKQPGFEDFLLPPRGDELLAAAVDGPIVVIDVSKYECAAIIIEQNSIRSLVFPDLKMEEIQRKAHRYYLEGQEVLKWLWDVVMNPILEALGCTHSPSNADWPHVWWIPTGPLTQYPLHATGYHSNNKGPSPRTVLDRVISSYSTSVRAILNGRRRASPPRTPGQALLVAMEKTASDSRLSFAAHETTMLRPLLASMNITPVEPGRRKTEIISHLPRCLLLEDWKEDPLEVANLLEMNIRNQAPFLAYLSACGTGQVRDVKHMDESIHLIGAFQLAGFRHAIGTLWEVNDELCVDMARITYEGIRDGGVTDHSGIWPAYGYTVSSGPVGSCVEEGSSGSITRGVQGERQRSRW